MNITSPRGSQRILITIVLVVLGFGFAQEQKQSIVTQDGWKFELSFTQPLRPGTNTFQLKAWDQIKTM